ncbi:hypothetical protein L0F63_001366 [Massospora cicadina]|nr:hypothetical protein L0F63_001366 [Massospora cicadina]
MGLFKRGGELNQIIFPLALAAKALAHGEEAEATGYKAPIKFTDEGLSNVLKVSAKDPSGDASNAVIQVTKFLERNPKIKDSIISVTSDPNNAKAIAKGKKLYNQIFAGATANGVNIYAAKIEILKFAYKNEDFFELLKSVVIKVIKDNPTLIDDFFAAFGRIVKANPEIFTILRQSIMDFSHEHEEAYKMGFELVLKASLSNVEFSSYALIHILKLDKIACGLSAGSGSAAGSCDCEGKGSTNYGGEVMPMGSSSTAQDSSQVSDGEVGTDSPAAPGTADPLPLDSTGPAPSAEGKVTPKDPAALEAAVPQPSYPTQPVTDIGNPQYEGQVEDKDPAAPETAVPQPSYPTQPVTDIETLQSEGQVEDEACEEEYEEEDCEEGDGTEGSTETPAGATSVAETPAPETPNVEGSTETPAVEKPNAEESTETPVAKTPAGEIPAGATSVAETPAPETPNVEGSTETPAVEKPNAEESTETPVAKTPAGEIPAGATSVAETPAAETLTVVTPAPETQNAERSEGSTETPAEITSAETSTAEESPETPAVDTPANETQDVATSNAEGSAETPVDEPSSTETSKPNTYAVEEPQPEESQTPESEAPIKNELELEEDTPEAPKAEGDSSEPESAENPEPIQESIQKPIQGLTYSRPGSLYAVQAPSSEGSTGNQTPEVIADKPTPQVTPQAYAVKAPKPNAYTI